MNGRWRDISIAVAAFAVGTFIWWHAAGPGMHAGTDFHEYVEGAQAIVAGSNPYHRLVTLTTGPGGLRASGYVYPPLLAVLMAGVLHLGANERTLWLLWSALNIVAVISAGYELQTAFTPQQGLRGSSRLARTLLFALLLLLPAVVTYDLWLGQADLLMASLAVIAGGCWRRGSGYAGLVLGLSIAVKPTMALLLLVWLWKGDWLTTVRGALTASALVAIPFALAGPHALPDYLTFSTHWNAFRANADAINQSPYGMFLRLFSANTTTQPLFQAPWLVAPLRIGAVIAAAVCWLRAVPPERSAAADRQLAEYLLALPLIILVSPLAEDIHFCVIVPALVGLGWLAWTHSLQHHRATWWLWGAYAVACIPRMQEIIFPAKLVVLPGQEAPVIGPLIVLARTGVLLALAVTTLVAGAAVLRAAGDNVAATTSKSAPWWKNLPMRWYTIFTQ